MRIALTGWDGGPGVSTWFFSPGFPPANDDPETMTGVAWDVRNAIASNAAYWPGDVTWTVEPTVDLVDSETGENTGLITLEESITPSTGSGGSSSTSRASMICANLLTGFWLNGRQLRGRHFLGPIDNAAIDTAGNIGTQAKADVIDMYSGLISGLGPRLCVVHRPKAGSPNSGTYADVTGISVMSKPAVLRSRRD
jgi:hypothetical protein